MGCELSKGREKELSGKGCIQIDFAIQIDLFISIHARILSSFWSHLQELQRNEDILQTLQPQLILLGPQLPQDMVAQLPKCRTLMLEKAQVAWTKRKRKAWQLFGPGFEVFQACSSLWLGSLAFLSNFHRILQSVTVEESSIERLQWALDLPSPPGQIPLSPVERRPQRSSALLCFQLTGGTTGSSKCVEVTQQMALHELAAYPKTFPELSHEVLAGKWLEACNFWRKLHNYNGNGSEYGMKHSYYHL